MTRESDLTETFRQEQEKLHNHIAMLEQALQTHQQNEQILQEHVHIFKQVLNSLSHTIIIKRNTNDILFANQAACAFYDIDPEDIHGSGKNIFANASYQQPAEDQAILDTGQLIEIPSLTLTRADGEPRHMQIIKSPLFDTAGQVAYIADIANDRTADQAAAVALRQSDMLYRAFGRNFPNGAILLFDHSLRYLMVDGMGLAEVGLSKEGLEGRTIWEALPPEACAVIEAQYRSALAGQEIYSEMPYGNHFYQVRIIPVRDDEGVIFAGMVVSQDITERKQAEEALLQNIKQEEMIRAQAAALAELTTPLLTISDKIVVMPLIGAIDTYRGQQVIDSLLEGVASSGARVAILDITGVAMVDTQVANGLLRAAAAVKLLGAQALLTGLRPEVAQAIVGLGVDLSQFMTFGSLQSGIAYAIRSV